MTESKKTFDELMRVSYEDFDIAGSPFLLPAFLRRWLAWWVSLDPRLFAIAVWGFHRVWGNFGRFTKNPIAMAWSRLAREYSIKDARRIASATAALDDHETFRQGCRTLGFRNCLQAMFYRGAFLDAFFHQGDWTRTEFTHPHQRPYYFIPGIPSNQSYAPEDFQWKSELESQYSQMRDELAGLLASDQSRFGTFRTEFDNAIEGWNTLPFYVNGHRQDANCEVCPIAAKVADGLLQYEEGELTMYSALNSQSYIPPHVGPLNGILRAHLPVFVPPECGLRVGDQEFVWEEGKILVFDDSFVHTVWNHSDQLRIVLFFNVWHPCLSQAEREALAALRRAYNETPVGRHWRKHQETSQPSTMQPIS